MVVLCEVEEVLIDRDVLEVEVLLVEVVKLADTEVEELVEDVEILVEVDIDWDVLLVLVEIEVD